MRGKRATWRGWKVTLRNSTAAQFPQTRVIPAKLKRRSIVLRPQHSHTPFEAISSSNSTKPMGSDDPVDPLFCNRYAKLPYMALDFGI